MGEVNDTGEEGADEGNKDEEGEKAIIPQLLALEDDKGNRVEDKPVGQDEDNPEHYDEDGDNPVLIKDDKIDGR